MLNLNYNKKEKIIGRRVKIKTNLKIDSKVDGVFINSGMKYFFGKKAIIIAIRPNIHGQDKNYYLNIDNCMWAWNKNMLEPIE